MRIKYILAKFISKSQVKLSCTVQRKWERNRDLRSSRNLLYIDWL